MSCFLSSWLCSCLYAFRLIYRNEQGEKIKGWYIEQLIKWDATHVVLGIGLRQNNKILLFLSQALMACLFSKFEKYDAKIKQN